MSYGYEPPQRRVPASPRSGSPVLLLILLGVCLVLGFLVLRQYLPFGHKEGIDPDVKLRQVTPRDKLWDVEEAIVTLAARASKSVAHIHSVGRGTVGTGSGFVWDDEGH